MSRFRFRRSRRPLDLAVDMAGVRMGERLLQAGAGDARAFAAIAAKVGLTGRACAVADTSEAVQVLERAAARQGVFVEVVGVQSGAWPFDAASFDIALVDGNALIGAADDERQIRLGEIRRVVRAGGRVLAVYRSPRSLMMRLGFESAHEASQPARALLQAFDRAGLAPARLLAEREGLTFVEAFRPA
jgi:ubiquinone/menaquinone biosynthesis C-methylase UbiE